MDFTEARHNMIEGQVRTNRVTDTLLIEAMEQTARESFLADNLKARAYIDDDIIVAPGRIMMEPRVMARLLQAAEIQPADMVMVVAAATGYETEVIARMAGAVVAIEPTVELANGAETALKADGMNTVSVVRGDVLKGHPAQSPFDVIFINGAVEAIPDALIEQMAEGGRLVCVMTNPGDAVGRATLTTKARGVVSSRVLFDASVPALPEFLQKPRFSF